MELLVHRGFVAASLRGAQDGPEFGFLHRAFATAAALLPPDRFQCLLVGETVEGGRDLGLPLHDGEADGVVHDLQVLPLFLHRLGEADRVLRQGEDAHQVREVGVRRGADEESARLLAVLAFARPEPGERAGAAAQRAFFRRAVHPPPFAALTAHDDLRQVTGGPFLVEPQRPGPRTAAVAPVDEFGPVEIVHMPPPAGADESCGDHFQFLEPEPPALVQRPSVDEPSRTDGLPSRTDGLPGGRGRLFLHHEPEWEPPGVDAAPLLPRQRRVDRRRVEPGPLDPVETREPAREPGLHDLLQLLQLPPGRPGLQPGDDRRVPGQLDERPRAVGGDDLAAADLSAVRAHGFGFSRTTGSFTKTFTSGSTSRRERFARNLA